MIVSEPVRRALATGGAVVALESTIIAHGFPYPDNLALARELETTVSDAGATPATIAVIDGVVRVGLDDRSLLALADGAGVGKAASHDLAVFSARGATAATTVSATAEIAHRAGIRVFATGGIGGVHRGDTGDVSADLRALAEIPVVVVSSGAKAILDLPKTVEALETLGVLVLGYETDEFPAFYCRSSGIALVHRADDPRQVADIARIRFDDLAQGGILVANPVPADAALDTQSVEEAVSRAIEQAHAKGIRGKALTPFLLEEVRAQTGGRAASANRALAVANARVAAEIAAALCPAV